MVISAFAIFSFADVAVLRSALDAALIGVIVANNTSPDGEKIELLRFGLEWDDSVGGLSPGEDNKVDPETL